MAVGAVARWGRVVRSRFGERLHPQGAFAPKELRAWRKRLGKLERAGQLEAADAEARRWPLAGPRSPYVRLTVGEFHLGRGQMEAAVSAFRTAWRVAPRRGRWKVAPRLARGMTGAGRYEEALELLGSLDGAMAPGPLGVERAYLYVHLGRGDEAVGELTEALRKNPLYEPAWTSLIDLQESLGRREEADATRRRRDAHSAETLAGRHRRSDRRRSRRVEQVRRQPRLRRRQDEGPLLRAVQRGYGGLAVDAVEHPRLRRNLPQPEVRKVVGTAADSANVVDLLEREGCPREPILLKIDIDSFDGPLLEAALAGFEPDVIHIEVNPDFPPPLKFAVAVRPALLTLGSSRILRLLGRLRDVDRASRRLQAPADRFQPPDTWAGRDARERSSISPLRARGSGSRGRTRAVPGAARSVALARTRRNRSRRRGVARRARLPALLSKAWDACVAASVRRSGSVLPFVLSLSESLHRLLACIGFFANADRLRRQGRHVYPGTPAWTHLCGDRRRSPLQGRFSSMRTVRGDRRPHRQPRPRPTWNRVDASLEARSR